MLRILFAHPDQKLSQIYVQHLKPHFLVDSVHDGLHALRKFKVSPPAMVVSDYELPILSGVSLLRFIRNHPQYHTTPFIFLSKAWGAEALDLAANDWLPTHSCNPDQLLHAIYHHLKTNKHGLQIHRA